MGQGKKILVVDDSPTIVEIIKTVLGGAGYNVITATDGLEALNTARKEKPDLIVLDIMLPKMQGYQVCRLLKFDERFQNIPIVMLTAKTEESAKMTGLKTGADEYLTKPVRPAELLNVVKELLIKE